MTRGAFAPLQGELETTAAPRPGITLSSQLRTQIEAQDGTFPEGEWQRSWLQRAPERVGVNDELRSAVRQVRTEP